MRVIKRNIGLEELKSRIPGLFPYLDFDELGNVVKHKATDSVDGCYGKIIPDLQGGMSYRTLMMKYYAGDETPMIGGYTVEDVIGKFEVDLDEYDESQILVPSYIYAAEAKELLDKMLKLKKACVAASGNYNKENCDYYNFIGGEDRISYFEWFSSLTNNTEYSDELQNIISEMESLKDACYDKRPNAISCCSCAEYEQMGGDKMCDFLLSITARAEVIATAVFDAFKDDAENVVINVNLNGSIEDFGYYTSAKDLKLIGDKGTYAAKCENEAHKLGTGQDDGTLHGGTDSKLRSFRIFNTYTNDNAVPELPDNDEDWLYFYRKGYVANYETINDNLGNISVKEGETRNESVGAYETNLEAYGNILYDITRDKEERSITFIYYINAHLKAKLANIGQDDDDNKIYYYKYPFEYESGGVKQTESYYYEEGGDIDTLSDENFAKLIGEGVGDVMDYAQTTNKKYAFSTLGTTGIYEKVIFDKNVSIEYGHSQFEYERQEADVSTDECYVLFKEDYLTGVHYKPILTSTVNIQRGNNAAFERHIRLGEVKTLEDMENYQNGSFFNIQETA